MSMLIKTLAAVAAGTLLAAGAFAQSAREIRGPSPYVAIDNEAPPKLIVDRPLPEGLAQGVFWAQYRVENIRILPVFGGGRPPGISTHRASAHHCRRPPLVVGGCQ